MGFFSLVWFLLIGAVAGWLAGKVVRGSGMGFLGNMAVGVVGALIGGSLFQWLGFNLRPAGFVTAFLGAVILLVLVNLVRKA
ncbi:MAG: GlsB/YeaQ/YmgE family stress response membrane protein [Lysobacterales bacterium]